ncbi:MAG: hypothetical protein ACM3NH_00030 [Candidatus Saccharibacteria bacterium]
MANTEMQSPKRTGGSTQSLLNIEEIKEGTVVLKDGSLRGVLVVSSTNFSLKSPQEQAALISAFQSFLNSLDFSVQILMQSRKLDINSYLDKLRVIMQKQTNELLRLQTQEYIEYIAKLVEFASIMNKTFYVIVPFSVDVAKEGFLSKMGSLFNPAGKVSKKEIDFQKHREGLYQRINHVSGTLNGMGLRSLTLSTEELLELLYNSYNLNAASPIHIKKLDELELVANQQEN